MMRRNCLFTLGCLLLAAVASLLALSTAWAQGGTQAKDNPAWDDYAFDLSYISGSGKLSFKELAKSGQPFVIFFWRTDCPLCHMQLPYVQQLQTLIDDGKADLRLITINIDDRPTDSEDIIKEKGLTFDILFDGHARRTDAKYQVGELGLPLAYAFKSGGEFTDYLTGFRSSFAKSVLQVLDLPVPKELQQR